MKIAFYAPFKPLGHRNPSGDLVIANGIVRFLKQQGHDVEVQSRLRTRWIYWKPWLWPVLFRDLIRVLKRLKAARPDLWLTYHTYYKAPDLLGPWVTRVLGFPYVVFQGIYSTKRKRRVTTLPGFYLNRLALKAADHLFTNRKEDLKNLRRLIPENRLSYIAPGIYPRDFSRNQAHGKALKREWGTGTSPVILTAAMFRHDVKTLSLSWLIQCCSRLVARDIDFCLVIAGSGPGKAELAMLARKHIPGHFRFAGKIPRETMNRFYSAGDLFAFPGIRESLGMVFLEAQSCALPVLALNNGGIPEIVKHRQTGFLVPMNDCQGFADNLERLVTEKSLCRTMGKRARGHVREHHDLEKNYQRFETMLKRIAA